MAFESIQALAHRGIRLLPPFEQGGDVHWRVSTRAWFGVDRVYPYGAVKLVATYAGGELLGVLLHRLHGVQNLAPYCLSCMMATIASPRGAFPRLFPERVPVSPFARQIGGVRVQDVTDVYRSWGDFGVVNRSVSFSSGLFVKPALNV